VKEHQKISVAATLHVALDNLSRIEAILEQSSDFHEIVCDDVPTSKRTAIRDEVRELRRIIEDMFECFALSPQGSLPPAERCSVRDAYREQLL